MKKNKGITMVALVISVILILIIAGVIVYTGSTIMDSARQQTLVTNMLLVQSKVKTLGEKANFENNEGLRKGTKINDILSDTNSNKYTIVSEIVGDNKPIPNEEKEDYYLLTQEDLANMQLEAVKLDKDQYYLANYKSHEIIYSKGYKHTDGKVYYKLSEIKDLTAE